MRFTPLRFSGTYAIDVEPSEDERGFFARTWCARELAELGLTPTIRQCSVSFNSRKGTLRGMHYQIAPHQETKIVRCTAGAVYDVLVDMRKDSPTFGHWLAIELSAENRRQLYIPHGVAHGFQTLCDSSEVFYQISSDYVASAARGVRWDDPAVGIVWPDPQALTISDRDRSYPDFDFATSAA